MVLSHVTAKCRDLCEVAMWVRSKSCHITCLAAAGHAYQKDRAGSKSCGMKRCCSQSRREQISAGLHNGGLHVGVRFRTKHVDWYSSFPMHISMYVLQLLWWRDSSGKISASVKLLEKVHFHEWIPATSALLFVWGRELWQATATLLSRRLWLWCGACVCTGPHAGEYWSGRSLPSLVLPQ